MSMSAGLLSPSSSKPALLTALAASIAALR
jgi:hypothetical protein